MNIIVCIKQVPDTTTVKIDPKTNTLIREGVKSIINPFDMYATEEGLRIRERLGGSVIVLTMGPPQAEEALREAISLGVDEAYLVSDKAFAGSDTLATSYTLSCAIKKIGQFDLIICGKQAIDGDTAQVGPGIAVWLDIPQITFVKRIEDLKKGYIRAERMVEEGYEIIESKLPCLITVVKEINIPRLPSLKGKLRSKNYTVKKLSSHDLDVRQDNVGLKGSPTQVIKIFIPPVRAGGIILNGPTNETVEKLVSLLKERTPFK
ncbi:MAG: electron transfer flavoprotein subunit beta/FixA family protein [Candidatus Omnitrophica bacterium]|nr:electron transfer flavoprotein subunit beta/FixA family protein [Candidatus Omnitrophota bacterium]